MAERLIPGDAGHKSLEHVPPGRRHLLVAVLAAYLAVAACTTWPLSAHLATHLPAGDDTLAHYWNNWWVRQALREGRSPYDTPYLFYPAGVSLVYKNLAWLHILPWLAWQPLVGGIAAYNLTFLLHLALCGLAAFALVYDLTGDLRAAFLGGLIYQCWPYRMTQPSHPNLMSTEWIPIFSLLLIRVVRRGRWPEGLLAGLSLALVGYTRWQLLIPAAVVGGVYLILTLPASLRRRQVQALLLAGAVAAVLLAPPALLLLHEWRTNPADLIVEGEETTMQADVLAYWTPPAAHPLLGRFTAAAYERYYAQRGSRSSFSPYLGLTATCLALVGVWAMRRRPRAGTSDVSAPRPDGNLPWVGMALALALLALGPILRVNGRAYPAVPMPYALAERLFVVRLLREPDRFNMSLALPVAVLAGHGIAFLSRRWKGWPRAALLGLIGGAISFEYLIVPLALQPTQVSAFYRQLAAEAGDFAVLTIPVDPHRSKPAMFAQTVHGRPILQGRVSRYPKGAFDYIKGQPWLRAMGQYSAVPPRQTDISRQLAALAGDGIRYIVLDKGLIGQADLPRWKAYLAVVPRFEDGDIVAYATTPAVGRDLVLDPEMAPGIGVVRVLTSTGCLNPGQALEVDVAWGTSAPPGRDLDVELALVAEDTVARQAARFPISRDWPAREWPVGAVAWGYYTLHISPTLPAGVYRVTLALVDPRAQSVEGDPSLPLRQAQGLGSGQVPPWSPAPVVVGQVQVSEAPCAFPVPPGAVPVGARFGDVLRLLGYQLRQDGEGLHLTLHWRSERRMGTDYKVFVHVFDPATGIPVAQDDAMPLRWTYPTSLWGPGEAVTDVIPISLQGTPAGSYGLAVGVYDPASGDAKHRMERLPVVDAGGQSLPDGRLILAGETIRVGERRCKASP